MLPADQLRLPGEGWEEAADPPPPDPELERDADDVFKPRRPKVRELAWHPVPGWPRFDARQDGLVREAATGRLLTPSKSRRLASGACYFTVNMVDQTGRRSNQYLHAIIARTFLGPQPTGTVVAHKSDNPADCSIGNLYYATRAQNAADARRNGGRDPSRRAQILARRSAGMDRVRAAVLATRPSAAPAP
jgi:hypothetical protein